MSKWKQYADALERTVWTLVEGAGAVGLVAGYNATPLPDLPIGWSAFVVVVLGALIAAGKGIIVTNSGNGSASTLPTHLEPVPAWAAQQDVAPGVGMPYDEPDTFSGGKRTQAPYVAHTADPEGGEGSRNP